MLSINRKPADMVGFLQKLERLIKWAIFIVVTVLIVAVVVQVFARTFMAQPPLWTEETSRIALMYILGLGAGASILTGDLVNVDLALMFMPKPARRFCELLSAALVSLFGFLLVPGAWEFTQLGAMQTSPALELQMQYVFASMLLFSVLLGVFGLVKFIEVLLGIPETELTPHTPAKV
jgi:TRAP-type C4-dicarboxylate transport system permease small subunit